MCQAVRSSATDGEIDSLPQYVTGTTTWLPILHRFEHLLEFDVLLGGHSHTLDIGMETERRFAARVSGDYVAQQYQAAMS